MERCMKKSYGEIYNVIYGEMYEEKLRRGPNEDRKRTRMRMRRKRRERR